MSAITVITGKLAQDPELRHFDKNGVAQSVTSFSVPINFSYTKSDGEKVQSTDWYRVSVFGKQAETVARLLHKGDIVYVEGRAKAGKPYEKNGEWVAGLELSASRVRFIKIFNNEVETLDKVQAEEQDEIPF